MIDEILAVLAEAGLITVGDRPPVNIEITRGDALVAYVFVTRNSFVHVKASELTPLNPAYQAHLAAWRALPMFVPKPLGFYSRKGWDLLLTQGVDAIPVQVDHLRRFRGVRAQDIISVMTGLVPDPDLKLVHADPMSLLKAMREYFGNGPEATIINRWFHDDAVCELRTVPVRPQHGDFVPNNLGFGCSSLVVFDWEDYGVVSLAGFDLCTLIAATLGFRAEEIANVMFGQAVTAGDWWSPLIDGYCHEVGMDVSTFRRLVPLYLAIFLFLKGRYGSRVKQVVGTALCDLIELEG